MPDDRNSFGLGSLGAGLGVGALADGISALTGGGSGHNNHGGSHGGGGSGLGNLATMGAIGLIGSAMGGGGGHHAGHGHGHNHGHGGYHGGGGYGNNGGYNHHGGHGGFGGGGGFGYGIGGLGVGMGVGPGGYGINYPGGSYGGGFHGGYGHRSGIPWLGALAMTAVAGSAARSYSGGRHGRNEVSWQGKDNKKFTAPVTSITVNVVRANNLKRVQHLGTQDPYVKAKMLVDGYQMAQTKCLTHNNGGTHPNWNGKNNFFTFYVPATVQLSQLAVVLEVHNDNTMADEMIGTCGKIELRDIADGQLRSWAVNGGGTLDASVVAVRPPNYNATTYNDNVRKQKATKKANKPKKDKKKEKQSGYGSSCSSSSSSSSSSDSDGGKKKRKNKNYNYNGQGQQNYGQPYYNNGQPYYNNGQNHNVHDHNARLQEFNNHRNDDVEAYNAYVNACNNSRNGAVMAMNEFVNSRNTHRNATHHYTNNTPAHGYYDNAVPTYSSGGSPPPPYPGSSGGTVYQNSADYRPPPTAPSAPSAGNY